jgi:hypothetical protein
MAGKIKKAVTEQEEWLSCHPRALCLSRKDPEFKARAEAARTEVERAECLREAIRRFPQTSADVLELQTELEK